MTSDHTTESDPLADLHTPEELLAGAEALLVSRDPQLYRAAVLEAITALEAYVHQTVFPVLGQTLDAKLVRCLEDRTKSDFDFRLSELVPAATGIPVSRNSPRWLRYKKAKELRNKVTHRGHRVTIEEAREAVDTVRDWLAFIGSTADVELSLLGLKKHIERRKLPVPTESEAKAVVTRYFTKTRAATVISEVLPSSTGALLPDLELRFGDHVVAVEAKLLRGDPSTFDDGIERLADNAASYLEFGHLPPETTKAAVIAFTDIPLPERYSDVERHEGGKVLIVVIRTGRSRR